MMKKILFSLLFGLSLFTTYSFTQCPEPDPKTKTKEYRDSPESQYDLSCSYNESRDVTNVSIDFRIAGDGPYDSVDVEKGVDPIQGRMSFQVKGKRVVEPNIIYFQLWTASANTSRYPDGMKLTIFVDGKVLASSSSALRDTWKSDTYTTKWFFPYDLQYQDFLKIIQAKRVMFQIGETQAELRPREFQRLRDLNNVIQKPDSESAQ